MSAVHLPAGAGDDELAQLFHRLGALRIQRTERHDASSRTTAFMTSAG